MGTIHKVDKFVSQQLSYVSPETVHLGKNDAGTIQSYQYVPLKDQLSVAVRNPAFVDYLHAGPRQSDDFVQDVFDGSVFVDKGKNALYLGLYYDDFNVVDPLGNKVQKHKLGAIYFSILNIPKHLRSSLQHIFLLALFKTIYIKKFGWEKLLSRLVADLKVLESSGIRVCLNNEQVTIRAFVQHVSGDNLGIHSIAGFTESFSADLCCRFCLADKEGLRSKFREKDFLRRDKTTHENHLEELKTAGFPQHLRSKYGIRDTCQLAQLETFDTISCFPPDAHHDILEGIVTYTLELVLTYLVKERQITVALLNAELERFNFGPGCKNRPQALRWKAGCVKVKQTASEAWMLVRSLPVIVGKLEQLSIATTTTTLGG